MELLQNGVCRDSALCDLGQLSSPLGLRFIIHTLRGLSQTSSKSLVGLLVCALGSEGHSLEETRFILKF